MIPKAKNPCEVITFFALDLSEQGDGSQMHYMALDSFSDYLFNLGTSNANTNLNLFNAIERLMNDKAFTDYDHPFTSVVHQYEEIASTVESIIKRNGGTLIEDDDYVIKKMSPILKKFYAHFSQRF